MGRIKNFPFSLIIGEYIHPFWKPLIGDANNDNNDNNNTDDDRNFDN